MECSPLCLCLLDLSIRRDAVLISLFDRNFSGFPEQKLSLKHYVNIIMSFDLLLSSAHLCPPSHLVIRKAIGLVRCWAC